MSEPCPEERIWRAELGQRLKNLREAADWTQVRLGLIAEVPVDEVSAYEQGTASVDLAVLWRLAAALRVPVTRLTGDDE